MSKFIHLTQGLQTVIDDEDYEKVRQFRWYAAWRVRTAQL
jgi:hypothetical protein